MSDASNGRINNRKEEFIGIDSLGRMILNIRDIPKDSNNQQYFDTEMIAAVPLNVEESTVSLLKANDLPEKMHRYFMIDGIDKILMFGSSKAYIYNITSNRFNEIQIGSKLRDPLSSNNSVSITKTDKAVCIADTESIKYAIDLTTETYLDTPPNDCKKLYSERSKEEIFKQLNLPDNFEFLYTPTVYKTYNVVKGMPESELPKDSEIIK